MPKIEIKISKDGSEIKMEALDFVGPLCEDALNKMAEPFGTKDMGYKDEYHAENTVGVNS